METVPFLTDDARGESSKIRCDDCDRSPWDKTGWVRGLALHLADFSARPPSSNACINMDYGPRRRVVSAPLLKTPAAQQTVGPPVASEPTTTEQEVPDLLFTVRYPRGKFHRPDETVPQALYQRIIENLHRAYVLAILIWADVLLLFAEFPMHTAYYLARDSSRDVLTYFFQLFDAVWRGGRRGKGISLYLVISQLSSSGKHVLEGIEWWYSAWRVRMERMGFYLWLETLIPFLGKSAETVTWSNESRPSYWPFETREEAFEYLDAEFNSDAPRNPLHFPTKSELSAQSRLARSLSKHILSEYVSSRLESLKQPADDNPPQTNPVIIRRELRRLSHRTDAKDIISWVAEFWDMSVYLGYFQSQGGDRINLNLQIGQGMLGTNLWKMVDCPDRFILGIALGSIEDSNYLVIAVPGGGVYLVMDADGGCEAHNLEDEVGYDVCLMFESIASVGTEVNLCWGILDESYSIEDACVDHEDVDTETEEEPEYKVRLISEIDIPAVEMT
jgi:hypothetical protein